MKKTLYLVIALLLTSLSLAGAQSQQEMNREAAEDFRKADAELLWIQFRDAEAAARASEMEGGSAYPMLYEGTRARLTRDRTARLKEWLEEYR
ncbi:MAG: lysozyme inhibitor LprI family protein [Candidatus Eremiobacterota bacterium]